MLPVGQRQLTFDELILASRLALGAECDVKTHSVVKFREFKRLVRNMHFYSFEPFDFECITWAGVFHIC